jgi:WD40 repeat protein
MAARLLVAALLLLTITAVPPAHRAHAADDPPPVLKLRAELGGGDTNWAQMGAYAPDGKTLYAVAGGPNSGLVYVTDPAAGRKLDTLKLDPPADAARGYPTGLAVSPDGKYLAVAYQVMSKDAGAGVKEIGWELVLWDVAARKVAAAKRGDRERWELKHLTFSPDGKRLAGNAYGYSKEIDWFQSVALVWDMPGLAQKHSFAARGHCFYAVGVALAGDADVLRVFHEGRVQRWNLATGKPLDDVTLLTRGGYAAFSPDGKTLAVLSYVSTNGLPTDAEVSLFDAQKGGKARSVARGHKRDANWITFSRDGKLLATASLYGMNTIVWDADNLAILATLPTYGHLAFAPDGRTLAVGGTGFWSVEGRHLFTIGRHMTQVWAVAANPKGWGFASAQNIPFIRIWDRATLKNTVIVPFDPGGRTLTKSLAYSPDGLTLATTDGNQIKFIKAEDGWVKFTAEGHTSGVNAVAFSPDGKHFASASGTVRWVRDEPKQDAGEVIIWEVERETSKARPVHTIKAHPAGTFSLAFSPDGKTLVTGGGVPDGPGVDAAGAEITTKEAVRTWDVATGKPTGSFPCDPRHHVNSLAWSPDGKTLAHTGIDGTRVRLIDLATGKERALLQTPTQALAFSPDGAILAAVGSGGKGNAQGLIELWDAATGKKIVAEVGHEQVVNCVAFSPDGKALVTGSSDGVLNLWDVNAKK